MRGYFKYGANSIVIKKRMVTSPQQQAEQVFLKQIRRQVGFVDGKRVSKTHVCIVTHPQGLDGNNPCTIQTTH